MLLQMAIFHSSLWLIFHCNSPYIHHIFSSQSSVHGHLGCFHVLAIINSAAMNIGVHVSFQIRVFVFSRYIPRSGIAGSYCSSIFNFLRTFYSVLHTSCTDLHFHQEYTGIPFLHILTSICYFLSF